MAQRGKETEAGSSSAKNRFSGEYLATSYLEFFEHKKHTIVPSANLVPDDPTLLFTAAGMVPFKSYYSDPDNAPYPTAASVQKCLRAGGKQSDLENVGRSPRHHTFFEMLGNFSFGDYFKKEAIDFAWELSCDVWAFDSDRIWISVYEDDDEAFDLWAGRIGIPKKRILRLGKADNFWGPVGDAGVCGPSSELHYDTGEERGCGKKSCAPGCDCDRFIEFWNLVFPQFFYTESGKYDLLPKPGIDTGMGLERVAFIKQEVEDNFHTDLFLPIRDAVARAVPEDRVVDARLAINVGADHVRALVFALSEGIMPANEGRGYVLRRLLRRALTKMQPFGVRKPFLSPAVDAVVETMGSRYPEIRQRHDAVKDIITAEEERFLTTVEQGLDKLEDVLDRTRSKKKKTISGKDAFVLYDTYGFPFELTKELAEDAGLGVDEKGYVAEMDAQRERGRGRSFHANADVVEETKFIKIRVAESTEFKGYTDLECRAEIVAFRCVTDGEGNAVEVVPDHTVFYPEGGGQVSDRGTVRFGNQEFEVTRVFRRNGLIVHRLDWNIDAGGAEDVIRSNKKVHLTIDKTLRRSTERNHTATHLLHAALRKILGTHVSQAGSLVAPDRLRFDFHHHHGLSDDEVQRIQEMVNDNVLSDTEVSAKVVSYKEAINDGAMALFGEKYGDQVRMVTIGEFSRELCGGTHLRATGEVGAFVVTHETAVAAGVRRIEALTGRGALSYFRGLLEGQRELAELMKTSPDDLARRAKAILDENESMRRKLAERAEEATGDRLREALASAQDIFGVQLVVYRTDDGDLSSLRKQGDLLRGKLGRGVGLLFLDLEKKPVVLIIVSDSLLEEGTFAANSIATSAGEKFSFRGGGKKHMAQLGVTQGEDFENIVDFVRGMLGEGG